MTRAVFCVVQRVPAGGVAVAVFSGVLVGRGVNVAVRVNVGVGVRVNVGVRVGVMVAGAGGSGLFGQ